ncbi:peptidyl-prolyl cis-trans isomerase FKBP16-1, chloroplastic isoform X1 [Solanum dulcamara]|uniref:peptidyl-prolyl cis-trans isomerase FKBP16-1, chloroplastic isoform X1 n=1 Tax=Solanum dulcamara TaxID=45834 RepID=UPI002486843B|nr:peptidyl-prolyl cis-trans isomerase FKBP16-1, chloroplastic isoform X1 [Solanum dulcamara]XP_055808472.1 peptidyl-prolyl cis-trans isomerase FKBP16-1, chloroplastic isoform X1 [Solanum dulcamara]
MAAPQLQANFRFRCFFASQRPCFKDTEQCKIDVPKSSDERILSLNIKKLLRRSVLQLVGLSPIFTSLRSGLSAPMQEMRESDVIRTLKLDSGVRLQDIVEGEGPEAREGDIVEINYVCRRSNGYFVHSTVDQFSGESAPVILPLDDKQVMVFASFGLKIEILKIIKGLKEVLIGMKPGGKRRALIPPSVGYINENLQPVPEEFGPRRSLMSHMKEPLIFEVQLLKVL